MDRPLRVPLILILTSPRPLDGEALSSERRSLRGGDEGGPAGAGGISLIPRRWSYNVFTYRLRQAEIDPQDLRSNRHGDLGTFMSPGNEY
jgi:hypothetical protein